MVSRVPALVAAIAIAASATACGTASPGVLPGDGAGAVVALAAVAPSPAPSQIDVTGLDEALAAVAEGFLAADPELIRPWLYDTERAFERRWLERAANLAAVPLTRYALAIDPSLPDLATESVRGRYAPDPVAVLYVIEEHAIEGFDASGPVAEDLFLTVVHTPDGWRIAADTDAEALGLVSADHLWDHGPVVFTLDGPVAALHHPGTASINEVLAEARLALADVESRWPLPWARRVPIIVPRDEEELGELLHVTFDLSNFIAFATATPVGELGEFRLTGERVVVNSTRFLGRSSETRRSILAHELLHVATRPVAGPFTPSWIEEGLAQKLGEDRSTTGTGILDGLVASGRFDGELPTDTEFTIGGRDRIFLSYQLAWSFLEYLIDTYGVDRAADFYQQVGQGSVGQPGRERWHVERAVVAAYDRTLDELRADWRTHLTR